MLSDDGSDIAAAVQTVTEAGFGDLERAVGDAFDGATISVAVNDGLFDLQLHQPGMLRPLRSAELSDGTLRFLLWAAALLSPSLQPALGGPLAGLVRTAAQQTQVIVVTHSRTLVDQLHLDGADATEVLLYKDYGETLIDGQGLLATPAWDWGKR